MPGLDRSVLVERISTVERHLQRVANRLPAEPNDFQPATDASDAVVLHLWQATQIVIDLALSTCVQLHLGTPSGYADAFRKLAAAGLLDEELAGRLALAAGFRNAIAHTYEKLDMGRVYRAATHGPTDLRAFLATLSSFADPA